ncbi:MAG: hypothetical protein HGB29_05390 [Chlorobiaceae bacterium]|nr:hypothetical protein [Chlorobiaceae bacterium]NTW74281.1 hypothetical protein [Chlorobiaceae bacterium]
MRLFPEKEKLKAIMKRWLPLLFAVAWTPMVWMLLAALIGPLMVRLFGSWQPVVAVLVVSTALVTGGMIAVFRRYGLKIFEEKGGSIN